MQRKGRLFRMAVLFICALMFLNSNESLLNVIAATTSYANTSFAKLNTSTGQATKMTGVFDPLKLEDGVYIIDHGPGWIRAEDKDLIASAILEGNSFKQKISLSQSVTKTVTTNSTFGAKIDISIQVLKLGITAAFEKGFSEGGTVSASSNVDVPMGKMGYAKLYTTNQKYEICKVQSKQVVSQEFKYETSGYTSTYHIFEPGEKLDTGLLYEATERNLYDAQSRSAMPTAMSAEELGRVRAYAANDDTLEIIKIRKNGSDVEILERFRAKDPFAQGNLTSFSNGTYMINRGDGWLSDGESKLISTEVIPSSTKGKLSSSVTHTTEMVHEAKLTTTIDLGIVKAAISSGFSISNKEGVTTKTSFECETESNKKAYMKSYPVNKRFTTFVVEGGALKEKTETYTTSGIYGKIRSFSESAAINTNDLKEMGIRNVFETFNNYSLNDFSHNVIADAGLVNIANNQGYIYWDDNQNGFRVSSSMTVNLLFSVSENGMYTLDPGRVYGTRTLPNRRQIKHGPDMVRFYELSGDGVYSLIDYDLSSGKYVIYLDKTKKYAAVMGPTTLKSPSSKVIDGVTVNYQPLEIYGLELKLTLGGSTVINKTLLKEKIDYARTLKSSDYTQETFAALQAVLAAAEAVFNQNNSTLTQSTVNRKLADLQNAIDNLKSKNYIEPGASKIYQIELTASKQLKAVNPVNQISANGHFVIDHGDGWIRSDKDDFVTSVVYDASEKGLNHEMSLKRSVTKTFTDKVKAESTTSLNLGMVKEALSYAFTYAKEDSKTIEAEMVVAAQPDKKTYAKLYTISQKYEYAEYKNGVLTSQRYVYEPVGYTAKYTSVPRDENIDYGEMMIFDDICVLGQPRMQFEETSQAFFAEPYGESRMADSSGKTQAGQIFKVNTDTSGTPVSASKYSTDSGRSTVASNLATMPDGVYVVYIGDGIVKGNEGSLYGTQMINSGSAGNISRTHSSASSNVFKVNPSANFSGKFVEEAISVTGEYKWSDKESISAYVGLTAPGDSNAYLKGYQIFRKYTTYQISGKTIVNEADTYIPTGIYGKAYTYPKTESFNTLISLEALERSVFGKQGLSGQLSGSILDPNLKFKDIGTVPVIQTGGNYLNYWDNGRSVNPLEQYGVKFQVSRTGAYTFEGSRTSAYISGVAKFGPRNIIFYELDNSGRIARQIFSDITSTYQQNNYTQYIHSLYLEQGKKYIAILGPSSLSSGVCTIRQGLTYITFEPEHVTKVQVEMKNTTLAAPNKSALLEALQRAGALSPDNYKASSWSSLVAAVENGHYVKNLTILTQSQVDDAITRINNAIKGLISELTPEQGYYRIKTPSGKYLTVANYDEGGSVTLSSTKYNQYEQIFKIKITSPNIFVIEALQSNKMLEPSGTALKHKSATGNWMQEFDVAAQTKADADAGKYRLTSRGNGKALKESLMGISFVSVDNNDSSQLLTLEKVTSLPNGGSEVTNVRQIFYDSKNNPVRAENRGQNYDPNILSDGDYIINYGDGWILSEANDFVTSGMMEGNGQSGKLTLSRAVTKEKTSQAIVGVNASITADFSAGKFTGALNLAYQTANTETSTISAVATIPVPEGKIAYAKLYTINKKYNMARVSGGQTIHMVENLIPSGSTATYVYFDREGFKDYKILEETASRQVSNPQVPEERSLSFGSNRTGTTGQIKIKKLKTDASGKPTGEVESTHIVDTLDPENKFQGAGSTNPNRNNTNLISAANLPNGFYVADLGDGWIYENDGSLIGSNFITSGSEGELNRARSTGMNHKTNVMISAGVGVSLPAIDKVSATVAIQAGLEVSVNESVESGVGMTVKAHSGRRALLNAYDYYHKYATFIVYNNKIAQGSFTYSPSGVYGKVKTYDNNVSIPSDAMKEYVERSVFDTVIEFKPVAMINPAFKTMTFGSYKPLAGNSWLYRWIGRNISHTDSINVFFTMENSGWYEIEPGRYNDGSATGLRKYGPSWFYVQKVVNKSLNKAESMTSRTLNGKTSYYLESGCEYVVAVGASTLTRTEVIRQGLTTIYIYPENVDMLGVSVRYVTYADKSELLNTINKAYTFNPREYKDPGATEFRNALMRANAVYGDSSAYPGQQSYVNQASENLKLAISGLQRLDPNQSKEGFYGLVMRNNIHQLYAGNSGSTNYLLSGGLSADKSRVWALEYQLDGTYKIKNLKDNTYADTLNYGSADREEIVCRPASNLNSQKWSLVHVEGDYYRLVNDRSGLTLTAQTTGAMNCYQTSFGGVSNYNQQFKLVLPSNTQYQKATPEALNSLFILIAKASSLNSWDYRDPSTNAAAFVNALNAAKVVNEKRLVTLEEVTTVYNYLNNQINALVPRTLEEGLYRFRFFNKYENYKSTYSDSFGIYDVWELIRTSEGKYFIRDIYSNTYLEPTDYSTITPSNIAQKPFNGSKRQQWNVNYSDGNYYILMNCETLKIFYPGNTYDDNSKKIEITPISGSEAAQASASKLTELRNAADKAEAYIRTDVVDANHAGILETDIALANRILSKPSQSDLEVSSAIRTLANDSIISGNYLIKVKQRERYLQADNKNPGSVALLQPYDINQLWKLCRNTDGTYTIYDAETMLCLEARYGSTDNNVSAVLNSCDQISHQKWRLEFDSSNHLKIINVKSNKVLSILSNSRETAVQDTDANSNNQRFSLIYPENQGINDRVSDDDKHELSMRYEIALGLRQNGWIPSANLAAYEAVLGTVSHALQRNVISAYDLRKLNAKLDEVQFNKELAAGNYIISTVTVSANTQYYLQPVEGEINCKVAQMPLDDIKSLWKVIPLGNCRYNFMHVDSGLYLKANGNNLVLDTYDKFDNSFKWKAEFNKSEQYRVTNSSNGLSWEIAGANQNPGALIQTNRYNNEPHQVFAITKAGEDKNTVASESQRENLWVLLANAEYLMASDMIPEEQQSEFYKLYSFAQRIFQDKTSTVFEIHLAENKLNNYKVSVKPGYYLISGVDSGLYAQAEIRAALGRISQKPLNRGQQVWKFEKQNDGTFIIKDPKSNLLLDIEAESTDNGKLTWLTYFSALNKSQRWLPQLSLKDLNFVLVNNKSGHVLTVSNNSMENGARYIQSTFENLNSQKFNLFECDVSGNIIQRPFSLFNFIFDAEDTEYVEDAEDVPDEEILVPDNSETDDTDAEEDDKTEADSDEESDMDENDTGSDTGGDTDPGSEDIFDSDTSALPQNTPHIQTSITEK